MSEVIVNEYSTEHPPAFHYKDDFYFFENDPNRWNYNPYINTQNADPYNNNKIINISSNNSYNMMKYNAVIMLKEILKHVNQYLGDDVKDWIFKKTLQGTKSDYWDILSITTNLFYYYLFRTEETINYKKVRLWFRKNPLYIKSDDETIKNFIVPSGGFCDYTYKKYLNTLTYRKLYDKVRCFDFKDNDIKYRFIIICDFLKEKIICGTAVYKKFLGTLCTLSATIINY